MLSHREWYKSSGSFERIIWASWAGLVPTIAGSVSLMTLIKKSHQGYYRNMTTILWLWTTINCALSADCTLNLSSLLWLEWLLWILLGEVPPSFFLETYDFRMFSSHTSTSPEIATTSTTSTDWYFNCFHLSLFKGQCNVFAADASADVSLEPSLSQIFTFEQQKKLQVF